MPKFKPWQIVVLVLLGSCSICSVFVAGIAALDFMDLFSTEVTKPISIATQRTEPTVLQQTPIELFESSSFCQLYDCIPASTTR